ncbi:MAG TPA: sigma-54 dependent transcriptional regulator, partial [Candidatus Manganitrophaceae bacterium]|nr:sigma-54 dependent transcriptional regulator [Candidatus Manganitrophaceae bacterium]
MERPRWEWLAQAKSELETVPIVVVGDKKNEWIVTAMKMGASNYLSGPLEPEELKNVLLSSVEERNLISEISYLSAIAQEQPSWLLSSCSPAMNEVKKVVDRVSGADVTVLIRGESGVGKGVVARAIYLNSNRREQPFVKVNCAALPRELLESELFGYEKGAFTGAYQRKAGKFGLAHRGTLFLDEISEMSAPLQAKLLHVLETGEFSRLGGEGNEKVDVRIIAATSGDLESTLGGGAFRDDLFYRLNVVSVRIPALRERKEEIPVLAEYFLQQVHREYNKPYKPLPAKTLSAFIRYDWPGNVRELENFIKRIVILGDEHGAPPFLFSKTREEALPFSLKQISRQVSKKLEGEVIRKVLNQTRWNRRKAAEILKISYRSLLYKIKESKLETTP